MTVRIHPFLAALLVSLPFTAPAQTWVHHDATLRFGIEADWADSTRLDNAHVDIQVGYPSDGFAPTLNFGHPPDSTTDGVIYSLDAAHLHGNATTRHVLSNPTLADYYAFTGAGLGDELWNLEQSNTPGMIFLGFNTKDTDTTAMIPWNPGEPAKYATTLNHWIKVELQAVHGPGDMSLYLYDPFSGPARVYFNSADGIDGTDSVFFTPNSHDHFNWAFTSSGLYEIDIRISTLVVPEPSTLLLLGGSALAAALVLRRRKKSSASHPATPPTSR